MIGLSLRNLICSLTMGVMVVWGCGAGDGGPGTGDSGAQGQIGDPFSPNGEPLPGMATVSWSAPTTNIDGTALSDLAGFRIYFDHKPLSKESPFTFVGNQTEFTVPNLEPGLYYFAVTAVDTGGDESDLSDMVTKQVS